MYTDTLAKISQIFFEYSFVSEHSKRFLFILRKKLAFLRGGGSTPPPPSTPTPQPPQWTRPLLLQVFFYLLHQSFTCLSSRNNNFKTTTLSGGGGISFNTGSSISTSWMWKLSPEKLPFPRTWNNKEMDPFFKECFDEVS